MDKNNISQKPTKKPKTKKGYKSLFFTFILLSMGSLALFSLWFWQALHTPKDISDREEVLFSINPGQDLVQIATNLEEKGLIDNKFLFVTYVVWQGEQETLQAGNYLLSPSMTIPKITEKIVSGQIAQRVITIVEGWNTEEIADYLQEKDLCSKEEFLGLINLSNDVLHDKIGLGQFSFLEDKPQHLSLEGYLFPDTYYLLQQPKEGENTAVRIIEKMLNNFGDKLSAELRRKIKEQQKPIFDMVTMASLLEKEVRGLEDKRMVSGILWKRLENNIPLQVDATISYITGKKTTNISIKETKIDSPYNTYKYKGLPRGPICNPGLESIRAAVNPQPSDYWFYLSTPEGKTIFSRNLEEHNIAKQRYLKN